MLLNNITDILKAMTRIWSSISYFCKIRLNIIELKCCSTCSFLCYFFFLLSALKRCEKDCIMSITDGVSPKPFPKNWRTSGLKLKAKDGVL